MSDKFINSIWSAIPKFAGDIKNKSKKSKNNGPSFKNFKNLVFQALESSNMKEFIDENFTLQLPDGRRPAIDELLTIAGLNNAGARRLEKARYDRDEELWKKYDEKKILLTRCAFFLTVTLESNSDAETAIMGLSDDERASPKHIWAELERRFGTKDGADRLALKEDFANLKLHDYDFEDLVGKIKVVSRDIAATGRDLDVDDMKMKLVKECASSSHNDLNTTLCTNLTKNVSNMTFEDLAEECLSFVKNKRTVYRAVNKSDKERPKEENDPKILHAAADDEDGVSRRGGPGSFRGGGRGHNGGRGRFGGRGGGGRFRFRGNRGGAPPKFRNQGQGGYHGNPGRGDGFQGGPGRGDGF